MKKKIIFLINTLNIGGAEMILTNTANALSDRLDITVQTVIDDAPLRSKLNPDIKYKSIIKTKSSFLRKIFAFFVSIALPAGLIHSIFIGNSYDYEVAFLEGAPTKIIGASKNRYSKKYAWVHIDLYNTFGLDRIYKNMQTHIECYKHFDKIVCVSETVKQTFIKRFGIKDNVIVKYNIVDDSIIREKAGTQEQNDGDVRIVTVGRLESQKGFDRLLKVMKRIKQDGIACKLIIVGEGSQKEALSRYIADNDLSEQAELVGSTDNPYQYMNSADFLVFPSRAEGYSTVVTEAIILGKAVIVTDCSGMKELLGESEYGLVVENNDEALYEGVKALLQDPNMREKYAVSAKRRAKELTMQARLKELEELFEDRSC